jgi:hypothetical protein
LTVSSSLIVVTPVTRVPGRASERTNLSSTGSMIVAMTIGVVRDAYHAAVAIGVAGAKNTSTFAAASSRPSVLKRSGSFSAERRSTTTLRPST